MGPAEPFVDARLVKLRCVRNAEQQRGRKTGGARGRKTRISPATGAGGSSSSSSSSGYRVRAVGAEAATSAEEGVRITKAAEQQHGEGKDATTIPLSEVRAAVVTAVGTIWTRTRT